MRTTISLLLLAALSLASVADATAQSGRLEYELRQAAPQALAQAKPAAVKPSMGFNSAMLGRVQHGVYSLVIPGWSQYRAGHRGRAIGFAAAEALIWGSWIFSHSQGNYREDRYQEFAQDFADVRSTDHDDEYWRAVALYRNSDEYNDSIRRENRVLIEEQVANGETVTIGLSDGTLSEAEGWAWVSEGRYDEYGNLRGDALSAFDRADLILLFAIVNRVVAFADAVRSGPAGADDEPGLSLYEVKGVRLSLDVDPDPRHAAGALLLGTRF